MEVITYKCPNCGGDLTFDPASGKYKCEYCLSSFTQEEAEKANPKAAEALNGEDDAAGAQEASDAQKESSTEETKGETEQGEAVVYTCPNCGATYHVVSAPPKTEGRCDNCGAELTIRKDDAPETVKARLEVYHRETEPLKAFYAARGKLKSVNNQPTIEATTAEIVRVLGIEP